VARLRFLEIPHGSASYHETVKLRDSVLRKPLGLSFSADELAAEAASYHLTVLSDDALVGCLVLEPLDSTRMQMRQVAVRPGWQRRGIGLGLIRFSEGFARDRGYVEMIAHARESAAGFYDKLGYARSGDIFLEVGIPHVLVRRRLQTDSS
jgi:N-acetylglutamate synthase-like GNAT family acetyltransferase